MGKAYAIKFSPYGSYGYLGNESSNGVSLFNAKLYNT